MNSIDATFLNNNQIRQKEVGAFVSIRYCVMSAIKRTGDHSMNKYFDFLQLAIDCVRDLRMYDESSTEVAYLIPNEAGIIEWPSDMTDYTKIGIPVNGQLYTLTVNENMLINRAQKCGVDIRQAYRGEIVGVPTDGFFFNDHFVGGDYVQGLYGLGGGFNSGYYKIDYKMRQIQFDGIFPQIVMEYTSTGIRAGTIISSAAIPVIREYQLWQDIENDPRIGGNAKDRKKSQYEEAVQKLRDTIGMFKLQEYRDLMYATSSQSIKR